jgi:hypothetical protein
MKKAEVAARDPDNRSDGLCLGEVSLVECEADTLPVRLASTLRD